MKVSYLKHLLLILLVFIFPISVLANTFSTTISSSSDDAEQEVGYHTASLSSSDLELVYDGHEQIVGMRFTNVDIPKNITITNAYVRFKAKSSHSSSLSLKIYAEDSGNSQAFQARKEDISNRAKTSYISWNNVASWSSGHHYNTPNISSIVQQVINRADWTRGNPITILIKKKDTNNKRRAYSKDGGYPAELFIEYSITGSGVTSDADICYSETYTEKLSAFSMCTTLGGMNCRNVIPIVNTSNGTLEDVNVLLTSDGILNGSFGGNCGVKDSKGSCSQQSNNTIGSITILGSSIAYDLDDMTPSDDTRKTYTESLFSLDFTNKLIYTTYTKNGIEYNAEVLPCDDAYAIPTLSIDDALVAKSNQSQTMKFKLNISPNATKTTSTIHYYTQDLTAKAGVDYVAVDNVMVIPVGVSSVDIEVDILANGEGKFNLIIDKPLNAGISDGNATGSIEDILICDNYESSSDDTSPGEIIQSMQNVDTNKTACIYGESENDDYDYFYFEAGADGIVDIHGISTDDPTSSYYLKITTSNGLSSYSENQDEHNVSKVPLHKGDILYVRVKESGSVKDHYAVYFDFNLSDRVAGDRAFTLRNPPETRNIKGNFIVGGNVNLCAYDGSNSKPWDGTCFKTYSNSYPSNFVDIDGDSSTVNSSSFELNVPNNSEVVWAGLYWQGVVHNSDLSEDFMDYETISGATTFNSNKGIDLSDDNNGHGSYGAEYVKFKIAGSSSYVDIEADQLDFADLGYSGFADVTSMINKTNPNGVYTVANIKAHQGVELSHGNYAGWSLVVIYKNEDEKLRNISLFDGYVTVRDSYDDNLTLEGFLTPTTTPINSRLSFFTMDGDNGDNSLYIVNESGTKTQVIDPNNKTDSLFNSSIEGVYNRNPNVASSRMDLDIIELTDVLGPKNTSAILQPRSGGDRYTPSFFIMSTELYEPRVCYYIDTIKDSNNDVIFEDKHFIKEIKDDEVYSFDLWISNMKKDETDSNLEIANLVQVYLNMTNFDYIPSSTFIDNIDENNKYITDAIDSDIGEYDASMKRSTWRIGKGATSSHGGTIDPATDFNDDTKKVFVKFKGKLDIDENSTTIDLLDYLEFRASFQTDSITIGSSNAQLLSQCLDLNSSSSVLAPPVGAFNVVQTSFSGMTDPLEATDVKNRLTTQISNKDFVVRILSLDRNDNITLKPYWGDVNITIIETPAYTGDIVTDNTLCQNAVELNTPKNINFFGAMHKDVTIQNTIVASKNASFKITYNLNTTPEYVCSRDSFAIRPDKFILSAYDTYFKSAKDYQISLTAGMYSTNTPTPKYTIANAQDILNKDVLGNGSLDDDKVIYAPDGSVGSLNGILKFGDLSFNITDGVANNIVGINFDDVGKVNIKIVDKTWAKVDIDNNDTSLDCNGAYVCGDINITFIPSHFELSNVFIHNNNVANTFTYMSSDLNMSAHVSLKITAKNDKNVTTTNFNSTSWENPVKVKLDIVNPLGSVAIKQKDINLPTLLNFISGTTTLDWNETDTSKKLLFNFERKSDKSINAIRVDGSNINVEVSSQYDALNNIIGSSKATQNVTFIYGRTHTLRKIFKGNQGEVSIYYEVYCNGNDCNKSLLPDGIDSQYTDDPRWFINRHHTISDGVAGDITQKGTRNNVVSTPLSATSPSKATLTYDKEFGYPYKATMENNASSWLIYNKYNISKTTNDFEVEFISDIQSWGGIHETNTTTLKNASHRTNRRLMW